MTRTSRRGFGRPLRATVLCLRLADCGGALRFAAGCDVVFRHSADRSERRFDRVSSVLLAFGARSVPLDRIEHAGVDSHAAANGLEAMAPTVIRIHAAVIDPDRANPGGQTLADLLVYGVRGLPVPATCRVVKQGAHSASEDEAGKALLEEVRMKRDVAPPPRLHASGLWRDANNPDGTLPTQVAAAHLRHLVDAGSAVRAQPRNPSPCRSMLPRQSRIMRTERGAQTSVRLAVGEIPVAK